MKTKTFILNVLTVSLLAVLLLTAAIAGRSSVQAERPLQGPTVRIVRAGLTQQTITASLLAEGMNNLGGFEFDLTLDPVVARVPIPRPRSPRNSAPPAIPRRAR